ncbi:MAG: SAM-dependent methyltransferase [Verrucomicrobiota bacterium]
MSFTQIESPQIQQAIKNTANDRGFLTMAEFSKIALYHPKFGYYTRNQRRVGKSPETDFYTSTTLRETFAPAIAEAAAKLLEKTSLRPESVTFTEIGSEPEASLLRDFDHPFSQAETIRIGQTKRLAGPQIVFSNELFDAQPWHTIVFKNGSWQERVVEVSPEGLHFALRPPISTEVLSVLDQVPDPAPEGYTIDLPTLTIPLIDSILAQDWSGAFIAFDYGKTWRALTHDTPYGTARAYSRHKQKPQLLESIGEQDLTVHICWDWLEERLEAHDFENIELLSQEAFFVHHAPKLMQAAFSSENNPLSKIRSQLRQLIHPSLMGQKFQVLLGTRN